MRNVVQGCFRLYFLHPISYATQGQCLLTEAVPMAPESAKQQHAGSYDCASFVFGDST